MTAEDLKEVVAKFKAIYLREKEIGRASCRERV
jgi:hypothetical protein